MYITPITTQYSFKGLFNHSSSKKKEEYEYIIKGQGGKVLNFEMKDDVLLVKGKPYTGRVRLEYKDGRKEHRDYADGRVSRSDLNGDGNPKVFYAYEPLTNGTYKQHAFYEGDDGIKGKNE